MAFLAFLAFLTFLPYRNQLFTMKFMCARAGYKELPRHLALQSADC
jgi:hypothetical protein